MVQLEEQSQGVINNRLKMFLTTRIEHVKEYIFTVALKISLRMIFPNELGTYSISKCIYFNEKGHWYNANFVQCKSH